MPVKIIRSIIHSGEVASSLPVFDKIYPATGEVIAKIEPASSQMLDEAVEYAREAQKKWAALAGHERGRILQNIAQTLRDHNEALSALEVRDVGKLYSEAVSADVPSGAEAFEFFAALAATYHGTSHKWSDT